MNVAIDMSPLSSGHSSRGIGVYTEHLIAALKEFEPTNAYSFFEATGDIDKNADIIHYPYFDPFFLTLPLYSPKPAVVTVHDLIPLVFPEHFPKGVRGTIKWNIQKSALKRKQRIITDSHCSKKDIRRIVGLPEESIDVVPLAPTLAGEVVAKKKNYLTRPYFLYVGDVNWNKNIPGLLEAFSEALKTVSPTPHLILVGKAFVKKNLRETEIILGLIRELKLEDHILTPGYVSQEELTALYAEAIALIQPSFYEGFGFPVVDAFSLGCPVICSKEGSLAEIAGPSLPVDPADRESIADAIKKMSVLGVRERKKIIADGYKWVKQFTWKTVARQTVASYEKVLGKK